MRVLIAALVLVATVRAGGQQTGPAAGATLFQQRCASCHNVEGRAP
jgi:mono/diheme cytochrome c family protein